MRHKLLKFWRTYKFCILLGLLLAVGEKFITAFFDDVVFYHVDNLGDIDLQTVFLVYGWPILAILHGVLTCIFLKRMLLPSVVLSVTVWVTLLLTNPSSIDNIMYIFSIYALIWPCITFVFSFVFAGLARFVLSIINDCKKNK